MQELAIVKGIRGNHLALFFCQALRMGLDFVSNRISFQLQYCVWLYWCLGVATIAAEPDVEQSVSQPQFR